MRVGRSDAAVRARRSPGWSRPRWLLGLAFVSAVAAALLVFLDLMTNVAGQPRRTVLAVALLAGSLTLVVLIVAVIRFLIELRRVGAGGSLPRLSSLADDVLGPTRTRYTARGAAPYVPRPAIDERLRAALASAGPPFPFVILVGPSKAGKSRSLVEAARAVFGDRDPPVAVLPDGNRLADFACLDPPVRVASIPELLWLDAFSALDLNAFTPDVLDVLSRRFVIVGTTTNTEWRRATSGSDALRVARAITIRAVKVDIAFDLTGPERAEAQRLYPDEVFRASVGETLVGGETLMDKFHDGRTSNAGGYALVKAAVDVRRAGLSRPVALSELRGLFPAYLRQVRVDLEPTPTPLDEALAWARAPVESQVALMSRDDNDQADRWRVLDYVVAAVDGHGGHPLWDIPEFVWDELIGGVPVDDCLEIGMAAELRGNPTAAVRAFRKAQASEKAEIAGGAGVSLGELLAEQGDLTGARTALQSVIDSGQPDIAPTAALLLGLTYVNTGRVTLGTLFAEQGGEAEALASFQQAVDSGDADAAPMAAANLGVVLASKGDQAGARAAFQLAIDSDDADAAAMAALDLGLLLAADDDLPGARTALRQAIDSGHSTYAPLAGLALGDLLAGESDATEAEDAYQSAIDSGDADLAPMAANNLGEMFARRNRVTDARAAYRLAIDSGHSDYGPMAAVNLGTMLADKGIEIYVGRRRDLWTKRRREQHRVPAIELGFGLEGDATAARAAWQLAIDSGHPDYGPMAAINCGSTFYTYGIVSTPGTVLVPLHHPGLAGRPRNEIRLGVAMKIQKDAAQARAAWQSAIDSGNPDHAPEAALLLAQMLAGEGDLLAARTAYQQVIDSGHPDYADEAAEDLAELLDGGEEVQ
jgi:tetratricopeptide (TPR) repeat protein